MRVKLYSQKARDEPFTYVRWTDLGAHFCEKRDRVSSLSLSFEVGH